MKEIETRKIFHQNGQLKAEYQINRKGERIGVCKLYHENRTNRIRQANWIKSKFDSFGSESDYGNKSNRAYINEPINNFSGGLDTPIINYQNLESLKFLLNCKNLKKIEHTRCDNIKDADL